MDRKMSEFISEIKIIPAEQEKIYAVLSDLNNLEKIKDRIPANKVEKLEFDNDSVAFNVAPVGQLKISIVEREAPKTIKFAADRAPMDVNLWIQLLPHGDHETKLKLTVKADLNPFLKPMLSKPLQDGVNQIADTLAMIPYNEL
jgi:carbon monoxide dehydrogenase subunit G